MNRKATNGYIHTVSANRKARENYDAWVRAQQRKDKTLRVFAGLVLMCLIVFITAFVIALF